MNHQYSISHDSISLVPMSSNDFELYRLLRNKNKEYFIYNQDISFEKQKKFIQEYQQDHTDYMFSIIHQELGWIGGNAIYHVDNKEKKAEYGRLVLDKEITKDQHYAVQCTQLIIEIAKNCMQLKKLYLSVYKTNIPAIKVYLQAGFVSKSTLTVNNHQMCYMEIDL